MGSRRITLTNEDIRLAKEVRGINGSEKTDYQITEKVPAAMESRCVSAEFGCVNVKTSQSSARDFRDVLLYRGMTE